MPSFRTELTPAKIAHAITLQTPVFTTGSCFSDAMGGKLGEHKFNTLVNPFGTTYNPYSIHKLLRFALHKTHPAERTYANNNEVYFQYDFHSEFSATDKQQLNENICKVIDESHTFLKTAGWMIITYGTAVVYERNDTSEIVANCHKMPSHHFTKKVLTENKILESFEEFYQELKIFNPNCKIILTVSPVRHIKDTLTLNSVSKSILRIACHTITETHPNVFYFPAYEIMLDDLRDYRFYKSDMLHPSAEAEEYIWQKFSDTFFDNATQKFVARWQSIYRSLQHRAFHTQTSAHRKFLTNLLIELEELKNQVNVEQEIATIKSQLNHAR
jgi:hypothetical protein